MTGLDQGQIEVQLGHWTDPTRRTGCTVVVFPEGNVASGEVRGGAPATRDFELLDPRRMVQSVDAVVISGGSAFGLAAAQGVAEGLVERGRGFETRAGRVPIVVAMSLFDLQHGVPRPGSADGRAALDAARIGPWESGRVGAGAGATVGKWRGVGQRVPSGIGIANVAAGNLEVTAVIAVNAMGDIDDGSTTAEVLAGQHRPPSAKDVAFDDVPGLTENTTIGVVWTNACLDKIGCRQMAEAGHDGFARALLPAHCGGDGDALVAVSVGQLEAPTATVRLLATVAVEQAIRTSRGPTPA